MPRPVWIPTEIEVQRIRRALARSKGQVSVAARELGIGHQKLCDGIRRANLTGVVEKERLNAERAAQDSLRIVMEDHRGDISSAARALRITPSELETKLEDLWLTSYAAALRPSRSPADEERARILKVIRECRGQAGQAAKKLGVSKGTFRARMIRHNLFLEAEALRAEANLSGPRKHLPPGFGRERRRTSLLALLQACKWNISLATEKSGVAPATFYKNMRELGVKRPTKKELHQSELIDALRRARGVKQRAADLLGIMPNTVTRWCREFEVDPNNFRR